MRTINRGWLKRQVAKGLVEARCEGHYTDDYAWDAANNFGRTEEFLPAEIEERRVPGGPVVARKEGVLFFDPEDFSCDTGRCYAEDDGKIRFYIHSNLSYVLRIREEKKPTKRQTKARAA